MSENNGNGTTTAIARHDNAAMGTRGIILNSFDALGRFSVMVEKSGFAPKGMSAAGIGVAIQLGLEVGLSPMQALQSTAVINGRPAIYGDAAKALVEASGLMEDYDQWYELDGKKLTTADGHNRTPNTDELKKDALMCCVKSVRRGRKPMVTTFSVSDAKAASLWGKAGPWAQYPSRMMMFRARGFNLRDNFGDVLKGLRTVEEAMDQPIEVTAVINDTPTTNKTAALADKLRERASSESAAAERPDPFALNDAVAAELQAKKLTPAEESDLAAVGELFAGDATGPYANNA